MMLLF
jgi:DNA-binding transcriptional LysR family regulator